MSGVTRVTTKWFFHFSSHVLVSPFWLVSLECPGRFLTRTCNVGSLTTWFDEYELFDFCIVQLAVYLQAIFLRRNVFC